MPILHSKNTRIYVTPTKTEQRHCPPRAAEEAACSNLEVEVEGEASRLRDRTAKVMRFCWDHHTGQELEFVRA